MNLFAAVTWAVAAAGGLFVVGLCVRQIIDNVQSGDYRYDNACLARHVTLTGILLATSLYTLTDVWPALRGGA